MSDAGELVWFLVHIHDDEGWHHTRIQARTIADAGDTVANRLRAERGVDILGLDEMHVRRLSGPTGSR